MDPITVGVIAVVVLIVMLALRVPVAFALAFIAIGCMLLYFGGRSGEFDLMRGLKPTLKLAYSNYFALLHHYDFAMVPLFIFLGNVASKAGITNDIYYAARVVLARVPGGVAMASVMGCGGFAAINGSSVACAAAMGKVCSIEMLNFGYDKRLATSSVAVGGSIGSMIPPSVAFILYAVFTETSINKLFMAGVLPGLLSLLGYVIVIYIWVRRDPSAAPTVDLGQLDESVTRIVLRAWPAAVLFVIIIGGIYGGVFTATESAGVSVLFALVVSWMRRRLPFASLSAALKDAASASAVLFLIAGAAKMFVAYIALAGIAPAFVELVNPEQLQVWQYILGVVVVYLILGMFLDPLGIMVLTLPFMVPVVETMGLDLIWFGVIVVKLLEIGLVTPPLGLNVFVIANVVGKRATVEQAFAGVVRFLGMDIIVVALLVIFPAISLFLPQTIH